MWTATRDYRGWQRGVLVDSVCVLVDRCSGQQKVGGIGYAQVAWVALVDMESGEERERVARNAQGGFFRIYQPNKWKKRQREYAVQVPMTAA